MWHKLMPFRWVMPAADAEDCPVAEPAAAVASRVPVRHVRPGLDQGRRPRHVAVVDARPVALLLLLLVASGCSERSDPGTPSGWGNAGRGHADITAVGCGSCHIIPGVATARGLVGPPLDHIARRIFLAGMLRNTPDNMVRWLADPQKIVPGNAMPDMGLSAQQARDITAYLYTLR
jgi:cytochrome c